MFLILSTILIQSIVIIMFNISILGSSDISQLKELIPFLNVLIAVITILIIISLKELNNYEQKEAQLKLMKENLKNTEELINLLRSKRYEYLCHIQTIGAMLYLEEYNELSSFLKGISKEYKFTTEIIRLGNPALTALVNTKREVAKQKGVMFFARCKHKLDFKRINSWEFNSLASNLIDNAIEASSIEKGKKWVKINLDYYDDNFIFEIENTGRIEKGIIENLFEPGVSSKYSIERGYGLYLAKIIVDKYNGAIEFKNTVKGTVKFTVQLPDYASNYDEKIS